MSDRKFFGQSQYSVWTVATCKISVWTIATGIVKIQTDKTPFALTHKTGISFGQLQLVELILFPSPITHRTGTP